MNKKKISRRGLLKFATTITAMQATNANATSSIKNLIESNKTIEALAQTIVPGKNNDPTGAPGAVEAETMKYLLEVEKSKLLPIPFGFLGTLLSYSLNTSSFFKYRKKFKNLDLSQKEVIAYKVEKIPGVHLFYKVLRAPFYTGAKNEVGFKYLGYPGANTGYPDFSFKKEMAKPHPKSIYGNLP